MGETLYTAGEIAKIAGVSLRTIRFYDAKGLLKPVSYSEAGTKRSSSPSRTPAVSLVSTSVRKSFTIW